MIVQLSLDLVREWMEEHAGPAMTPGGGDEERDLTISGLAMYQPYDGILALKMVSLTEPAPDSDSDSFHPIHKKAPSSVNYGNVKIKCCRNLPFSDSIDRNSQFNNSLVFDSLQKKKKFDYHQGFYNLHWLVRTCLVH